MILRMFSSISGRALKGDRSLSGKGQICMIRLSSISFVPRMERIWMYGVLVNHRNWGIGVLSIIWKSERFSQAPAVDNTRSLTIHYHCNICINLSNLGAMMISVRRFLLRPSAVSLSATGINSPRPQGCICSGFTP